MRFAQAVIGCIFLSAIGCTIPLRKQFINDDLFPSPEVLENRLESIKAAWASHQTTIDREFVFRELAGTQFAWKDVADRCKKMLPDEIHGILYPRAQVLGTVDELNRHAAEMCHFSGCSLDVKHLERSSMVGFLHYTIHNVGHDQKLILIFEVRDGSCSDEHLKQSLVAIKTVRIFTAGREKVNEQEVVFYWDLLFDVLQGTAIEAGKNAGKAITF